MKTKHIQYETHGTCSKLIDVTADENDIIQQVFFLGGCNGNLQGVSQLVRGQHIDDVIKKLDVLPRPTLSRFRATQKRSLEGFIVISPQMASKY